MSCYHSVNCKNTFVRNGWFVLTYIGIGGLTTLKFVLERASQVPPIERSLILRRKTFVSVREEEGVRSVGAHPVRRRRDGPGGNHLHHFSLVVFWNGLPKCVEDFRDVTKNNSFVCSRLRATKLVALEPCVVVREKGFLDEMGLDTT